MSNVTPLTVNIPLNRVEGDLELKVELEDGYVTNAWSKGTMYRGFENMLKGRGPRDGLVLTPRICGICGTAHLLTAVKALEMICDVALPNNAVLVRNLALMAEHVQSDLRHAVLLFMKDFLNPLYENIPLYEEAVYRYEAFRGKSVIETVRMTKKILEIVAILGGQWPNAAFMVPGGIAGTPTFNDLVSSRYITNLFRSWYEEKILGCTIERWQEVQSESDLQGWMNENESHHNSELGFFIRYAHQIKLHDLGAGHGNFLSFGQLELPKLSAVKRDNSTNTLFAPGYLTQDLRLEFDQSHVSEHVTFSHFKDYPGGKHPFEGETTPYVSHHEEIKYSFTKAPRYNNMPAETGPLAQMLNNNNPLFSDIVNKHGPNAYVRELARLVRPAMLLPIMQVWLDEIDPKGPYYSPVKNIPDGRGYGLIDASRGALGHWVEIRDSEIARYQIITPTAWNGSPRDQSGIRGPWEEAVIGTQVRDPENPVEIGHIIRSFDACQVCSVHTCRKK